MHTQNVRRSIGVVLVGLTCVATSAAAHPHAPSAQLGATRIEVPMDTSTRHPIIELTINNQGPFRFVVDSGAGATVLDDDLARKLDLPMIGMARTGDASGQAAKEMPLVSVERVGIGPASFSQSIAVIGDLDAVWHDQKDGADGVLGFNTFSDCLVTFDYPKGKLILENGSLPPADGQDILAFTDDRNIPTVALNITGIETPVTLDTGAARAGVLAADLEGKIRTKAAPKLTAKARRMNTAEMVREARVDGTVMLGRHKIQEPIFHFSGERSAIGYDIFRSFAITFDQKARTVRFTRGDAAPITMPTRYTAGFGAKPTDAGREVWYALEGLPAANAGLKEGDLIVAANGKAMREYDVTAWRTLLESPGTVQLDVRRDGAPVQIKFDVLRAVE